MRRKRKRFTWLPIEPNFVQGIENAGVTWFEGFLTPESIVGGTSGIDTSFLVADGTQQNEPGSGLTTGPGNQTFQTASLRDLTEGQDYVVERIVGKFWAQADQFTVQETEATSLRMLLKAGIAVVPVDDDGNLSLDTDSMSPFRANNVQQSWMWQRSWILNNNFVDTLAGDSLVGPTSTHEYGSVHEGGHLDVKSVRRLTRDQRLVMIVEATTVDQGGTDEPVARFDGRIRYGYDIRVLGAMRRGRHKSTFA